MVVKLISFWDVFLQGGATGLPMISMMTLDVRVYTRMAVEPDSVADILSAFSWASPLRTAGWVMVMGTGWLVACQVVSVFPDRRFS